MVIELYCGSCAFVTYIHSHCQLESNTHQDGVPDVWYMCIDCLQVSQKEIEQKYAKWGLACFLKKEQVVYIQQDLRKTHLLGSSFGVRLLLSEGR